MWVGIEFLVHHTAAPTLPLSNGHCWSAGGGVEGGVEEEEEEEEAIFTEPDAAHTLTHTPLHSEGHTQIRRAKSPYLSRSWLTPLEATWVVERAGCRGNVTHALRRAGTPLLPSADEAAAASGSCHELLWDTLTKRRRREAVLVIVLACPTVLVIMDVTY